jgi:lipid II:glycine glycyltransferase (peptidoglycan interpeptide bridge formation enzyme)
MKELEPGYSVEVDTVEKDLWNTKMLQFDDASYYQTWSYGDVHSGKNCLSHLVLKKNGKVAGMAQAWIFKVPVLPIGMAYINWGPMWMLKGESHDVRHLRNMIRALHNEYLARRRYFLRIIPQSTDNEQNAFIKNTFAEEGFSRSENPVQTVMIDLSPPLEEIRRIMDKKWRQTLQSGEKQNLDIIEGSDDEICRMAKRVFTEMKDRKQFFGGDQKEVISVHEGLPEDFKLRLAVCRNNNEPVAVLGWTTFGSIGLPLVAATGHEALKLKASYVLWWKMIEYYKSHGFSSIDANGVNEKRNPGGYLFKTHIIGKRFQEPDRYIGCFDACDNPLSLSFFKLIYNGREFYINVRRKWS